MREAYITDYKGNKGPIMPIPDVDAEPVSTSINCFFYLFQYSSHSQVNDDDFSTFMNISVTKHAGSKSSEFNEYLQKPIKNVKEPLKWWVANCYVYPNLFRMALDYLSIPGIFLIHLFFFSTTNCTLGSYIHSRRTCFFSRPPTSFVHSQ